MLDQRILKLLKETPGIISGETLAKELGVSRVAIWKAIKRLKAKGYALSIHKKGYLLEERDFFLKEDLDNLISSSLLFREAYLYNEVSSTMDIARELAEQGKRAIVIAERQTSGRGRLGRAWESEKGGLWLTLILHNPFPLKEAYLLTYLSATATAKALWEAYGLPAKVKWPNDVLVQEKKIAGILLEIKAEVDVINYALIGLGVNINNPVEKKEFLLPATSVAELLQKKVDKLPFLSQFLSIFEELYQNKGNILPEWKKLSLTLGRAVKIITSSETILGVAQDIDEEGALIVQTPEGKIKRIFSGDCFHLRDLTP